MPLLLILLAIVVAAVSAAGGAIGSGQPSQDPVTVPNPATLPESLIAEYAPLVYFHPRDSYRPMSATDFIADSRLMWRGARGEVADPPPEAIRLGYRCLYQARGCYLFNGYAAYQLTRPHETKAFRANPDPGQGFHLDLDDGSRRGASEPGPVYYEALTRSDGMISITYWLFYGFSRARLNARFGDVEAPVAHEGDWERIEVILEPSLSAEGQLSLRPDHVILHQHSQAQALDWERVCKASEKGLTDCRADTGHPVVYSARGSHASYAEATREAPCAGLRGFKLFGCRVLLIDVTEPGPKWLTWRSPPRNALAEPWYGFGGAWGRAGGSADATGPLGPSYYKICPPLSELQRQPSACTPALGRTPFDDLLLPGGGI